MPRMPAMPGSLLPSRHPPTIWLVMLFALTLLPLLWWVIAPGGVTVEVAAKTWRRDIEIEKRIDDSASVWCDELPANAHRIQRLQVADARQAGSAVAERCHYLAPQWRARRTARAEGALPQPPAWPQADLASAGDDPDALGAERLGERHEHYELLLHAPSGREWVCRLPLKEWQAVPAGSRFRLSVDRYGVANCASVPKLRE